MAGFCSACSFCMACCRNFFRIAVATLAGVSTHTGCGTACFCCHFACKRMTASVFNGCLTYTTLTMAGFRSACSFCMACCGDFFRITVATLAGVGTHTGCGTACFCCHFACKRMTASVFHGCLTYTTLTMAGFRSAVSFGMTCCRNFFRITVAALAGVGTHTGCGTACCCCYFACKRMAASVFHGCLTYTTLTVAGFCSACSFCMACCRNFFRIAVATLAGVSTHTGCGTACFCCHFACKRMTASVFHGCLAYTTLTMAGFCSAGCLCVTCCGNILCICISACAGMGN